MCNKAGDWDSLQAFIEEQWRHRGARSLMELVQAGQLSQYIGTPSGEGLIRLAAKNLPDDAMVLTSCDHAASSAGWEDDPQVSSWLQKAADLSESLAEGPIPRVSLDFIFERQPKWEAHESRMSDLAIRGEAPLFAVAKSLNQPFLRLVLLETLSNIDERDVRKRSMIMATSGARSVHAAIPEDAQKTNRHQDGSTWVSTAQARDILSIRSERIVEAVRKGAMIGSQGRSGTGNLHTIVRMQDVKEIHDLRARSATREKVRGVLGVSRKQFELMEKVKFFSWWMQDADISLCRWCFRP